MSIERQSFVIDRFEGHRAVLVADDSSTFEVDRALLPEGARPGAVIRVVREGPKQMRWEDAIVDEEATAERAAEAAALLRRLKRRDPGGDVSL